MDEICELAAVGQRSAAHRCDRERPSVTTRLHLAGLPQSPDELDRKQWIAQRRLEDIVEHIASGAPTEKLLHQVIALDPAQAQKFEAPAGTGSLQLGHHR